MGERGANFEDESTSSAPTGDRDAGVPAGGGEEPAGGDAPPASDGAASGSVEDRVIDGLKNVIDPELGINIVDLGLVYEVAVEDDTVHVEYTLTTMGCPIGPLIEAQMKQTLDGIEGVDNLEAEMVFSPPWSPDKMSEEAKAALGMV